MFVQFFCVSRDAGGQRAACANPNRLIKPWRDPSGALQWGCPAGNKHSSSWRYKEVQGAIPELCSSLPLLPRVVMAGCLLVTALHRDEGKSMIGKSTTKILILSIGGAF